MKKYIIGNKMAFFKVKMPMRLIESSLDIVFSTKRYHSFVEYENCLLDKLVSNIDYVYRNEEEFYQSITPIPLMHINALLYSRRYILSPLKITSIAEEDTYWCMSSHIVTIEDAPHTAFTIKVIPEDALVLIGLGLLLNTCIHLSNLHMENSLGLKVHLDDFYGIISSRGNVMRLYKFDLSNSLMKIDRESLLRKLSDIILDKDIMKLVSQFVYLPIHLEGNEPTISNVNIPSVRIITDVLLDKEF